MKRIGFIGVGTMGEPMAANLIKAGFTVIILGHRNPAPVERLVAAGAQKAQTPAEIASQTDVVMLCLPNDAVVEEVILGANGILAGGREGLIIVDTSTISPLTSQRLAKVVAGKGMTLLDAPLSGGQTGAIAGTLAIMVGGPREAFEKVRPVLEAVGKNITYVGENGTALVVKLGNNLIVAAEAVAIAEALTLAKKAGIDTGLVHKILSAATARSWILEEKVAASVLKGDLKPGFKLSLMHKDVGLALDLAKAQGTPAFITALVHQLYTQALGLGKGDLDSIGISQLYEEATGVDLRAGN
ncbi:MAG: NAD(P)-dependent oxidoreductase [Chloroflexi bacterium]|nr:NAD(P)-dependent oxidoreductase [Chloroflexota bacterium]